LTSARPDDYATGDSAHDDIGRKTTACARCC